MDAARLESDAEVDARDTTVETDRMIPTLLIVVLSRKLPRLSLRVWKKQTSADDVLAGATVVEVVLTG